VSPADSLHLTGAPEPFVSRAGRKLAAGLDAFPITVNGVRAVDVGASTGGFTDCLLQRGASTVVAIDVGYGQMHWRIREDERVDVVERTNIRTANIGDFGPPFDVVVADLSFISLRAVADALIGLGSDSADWVLLIKPQFEVGRDSVGKGGIVRDRLVREQAVVDVTTALARRGLGLHGVIPSPVAGTTGNIEYVAWLRRGQAAASVQELLSTTEEPPL
jgi:23S rRNA (cytidine1920-2'-O)/16S rRNA (cytidine1409-2'-O)-methyltransferase